MTPSALRAGRAQHAAGGQDVRRQLLATACLLVLLSSCGTARITEPTPAVSTATPGVAGPATIRFALIGTVTDANVWALFEKEGSSFNNYAVRSAYWPRLYRLSIPERRFTPEAASGMPSAVQPEGALFTATVPLRGDLTWSDGRPFTADDVAFTVNTAVKFHLGFDWQSYYDGQWLDRAEALDAHTVKFFFKRLPNTGVWQYGALQGPIVERAFWEPKIAAPAALLPGAELAQQMQDLQSKISALQGQVNALNLSTYIPSSGEGTRQTQAGLRRQQGDLDKAINDLARTQAGFHAALNAARAELFALVDAAEPRLGEWQPARQPNSAGSVIANEANPRFPGDASRFERADYILFATQGAAVAALQAGKVDVILDAAGPGTQPAQSQMTSPTRRERFVFINPVSGALSDAALRSALACVIDQKALAESLGAKVFALESYIAPQESLWYDAASPLPCSALDAAGRMAQAVSMLKAAGYTWSQEPAGQTAGQGLAVDGKALAAVHLLTLADDPQRTAAAAYIQEQALLLGIPLRTDAVTADAIDFAVFSSHRYDMAILGWNVGAYPGYLCDWFAADRPLHYEPSRLSAACEAFGATSDLEAARKQMAGIQSILAAEVPLIPLYAQATSDLFRNVTYPFAQVLDGLSGVYGAPALASPAAR